MKSPILRKVTGPINQIDAELSRAYSEAKAIYDGSPAEERKSTPPPKHTRVRIEDATPEAVQPILRDSPDGVLLVRDELSGWFGSIDKYSGSCGGSADRGFWLQAFNGGIYAFDRVSRGSAVIPNLSVSVLGGIQEETLRKVAEDGVDDGLLQRLFTIMLRPAELGRDEPGPLAAGQYEDLIHRLHAMVHDLSIPRQFTDDAQIIRRQLEQKHLDLLKAYEKDQQKVCGSHWKIQRPVRAAMPGLALHRERRRAPHKRRDCAAGGRLHARLRPAACEGLLHQHIGAFRPA